MAEENSQTEDQTTESQPIENQPTKNEFSEIIAEALEANNKKLIEALTPFFDKIEGMAQVVYEQLAFLKSQTENNEGTQDISHSQIEENEDDVKIKISRKRKISKSENADDDNEEDEEEGENPDQSIMFCETCKQTFTRNDGTWTRHIKENGCKPFKCPKCDKLFVKRYTMRMHMSEVHSTDVYECNIPSCSVSVNTIRKLTKHQINVHGMVTHKFDIAKNNGKDGAKSDGKGNAKKDAQSSAKRARR
ncbi:hypothetical protein PVAND_009534 [Polypedilum vanderplanki]|uniref:C2H2-type domain-containing protein n=1 Tax=Polypedilum vanderplanki TaxID=319348 RepID=A0A9J6CCV7_POLVA|nr:hypothetical protein PVAND_009534 [Polypedilum vanderplanki]